MHTLLDPPRPDRPEALAAVHRWLAGTIRGWGVARRLLALSRDSAEGRERADGLGVFLAWHALSRELLSPPRQEAALSRARDELLETLADSQEGGARSAMGVALAWALPRFGLSPLPLRARIEALERDAHVRAFASGAEIRAHLARTVHPEARIYLCLLGVRGEREELLALALANALGRIPQLSSAREELQEKGRLVFSIEELGEVGLGPGELFAAEHRSELDRLFESAICETRRELLKGWPLCLALGPWRGRQLAFILRWFAADLTALEYARRHGKEQVARGGKLRRLACITQALASRRPSFR